MAKKHYEENFKKQIVKIYNQGNHSYKELSERYGIAASTMRQWVIRYNNTRSFNAEDNKTDEEKRMVDLIISNREKYSISAMCEFLKGHT